MRFETRTRRPHNERGVALVAALVFVLMAVLLTGASTAVIMSAMKGTRVSRAVETSRAIAEAGTEATLFAIEAATNPNGAPIAFETYLANVLGVPTSGSARPQTKQFTGTLEGGSYTVTLSDPTAGDNTVTLTSVGTDTLTNQKKTMVTLARSSPVEALNYAMFGNKIVFHNHNKTLYGVTLNTSMFSNGVITIDPAIQIVGQAQAVNYISPSKTANGLPGTSLTPSGQQGDPDPDKSVPTALITQVVPSPEIKPFPTFDFAAAQAAAQAKGREMLPVKLTALIAQARACAVKMASDGVARVPGYAGAPSECSVTNVYLSTQLTQANVPVEIVHYKAKTGGTQVCPGNCAAPRFINVPNMNNPAAKVPLGSADGVSNPANNTDLYEIRLVGNPLSDTLMFIKGSLTLTQTKETLVQIQGSLIVNGGVTLSAPLELLAWHNRTGVNFVPLGQTLYSPIAATAAQAAAGQPYDLVYSNWPGIAANGSIKASSGSGGPIHIEGTMYSVSEVHFHKSETWEPSYIVGGEIADTVHNCQFFSLAWDPQAQKNLGFQSKAAGRVKLMVVRTEDR